MTSLAGLRTGVQSSSLTLAHDRGGRAGFGYAPSDAKLRPPLPVARVPRSASVHEDGRITCRRRAHWRSEAAGLTEPTLDKAPDGRSGPARREEVPRDGLPRETLSKAFF